MAYQGSDMTTSAQVLALVSPEMARLFERRLKPLEIPLVFVGRTSDLLAHTRAGEVFSVIILPATLPNWDVWAVWGELALLTPRPEFLIYARSLNFELWAGVLEAGGHDLLVEPFKAEEVQKTILDANRAFEERQAQDAGDKML